MIRKARWQLASMLLLLVAWQLLSLAINNARLLPGIDYILFHSLPGIAQFAGNPQEDYPGALQVILVHTGHTLMRLLIGLFCGTVSGIIIGMAIHFFHLSRNANEIVLAIVRSIPLFALIPLFLYWFGGKELGIYLYIWFAVMVIIATNCYEAICNVPPEYSNQARLLGASRLQIFASVYAPAIGPEMIGGLRNVLGLSWAFALGAEYLSASSGLGYLVYQSYIYSDMGKLLVFAFCYGVLGVAGYMAADRLLYRLRRWHIAAHEERHP